MENVRQDILSRVSHEFRTPLTSILGYAEVILEDPLLPDDLRRQFVQIIKDEGQRLAELVNELVSLHSPQQGQTDPERSDVSANDHGDGCSSFVCESADSSKSQTESEEMQCLLLRN